MFEVGENADGILAGVLFLIWLSAAILATRLAWRPTPDALHKSARRLLRLLVAALVVLAIKCVAIGLMLAVDWIFADNRVIVQMPLLLLPMLAVALWTVPGLRALANRVDAPVDAGMRSAVADPRFVVPVQVAAVATVVGVHVAYVSRPVPSYLDDIATHSAPILLSAVVLWFWQGRRLRVVTATDFARRDRRARGLRATAQAAVVVLVVAAGITYVAQSSRLPDRMSMMSHDNVDYGGGPSFGHGGHGGVSVDDLRGPRTGKPDRAFTLTAKNATVRLSSGAEIDALTYNGQSPGPELRVREGDLVEVTLHNEIPDENVTIHWHGLDVPNGEDGVAGATQNAVEPGGSFTYRFLAEQVGTFWYHTHQNPLEAIRRGLFGALIVEPRDGPPPGERDFVVQAHEWRTPTDTIVSFGTSDTMQRQEVAPGTPVRLRLVNTDNNPSTDSRPRSLTVNGAPVRVAAIDGVDVNGPTPLIDPRFGLATGGRYDVTFTMPAVPVRLTDLANRDAGLVLAPPGDTSTPRIVDDGDRFDPLSYGSGGSRPFDAGSSYDRSFTQLLDDRLSFYNGGLHLVPTINGHSFPDTPTLMVRTDDVVKVRIVNRSHQNHPMHLHGHHALVLSRNGVAATGSPWWIDSLDVIPGEIYEIGFTADNPGLWMDHCHNLDHAANGMVMHLAYEGVTSPYELGRGTPNQPE
ncbi:multicopper oxidase family protein [Micromonospora sp. NPDC047753]|uniref:multicopper oxidase family protein n=1 Tax=Micromonospora sp. NPDC047753 TaxID=3154817 RepID=UPI0033F80A7F